MKTICYSLTGMIIISLTLIYSSCTKKDRSDDSKNGLLKLKVNMYMTVSEVSGNLKAITDNFQVKINKEGNDENVATFEHASDIPDSLELPEGNYYAVAESGNNPVAEYENPYYYGRSENFSIVAGQTASANINCSLSNIMVSVTYSSQVINSFKDYNTTVSNPGGSILFSKNETRTAYFNAGPLHIESKLTYSDNSGTDKINTILGDISSAQTGKHYEIHIDASPTKGSTVINIHLNDITTEIVNLNEGEAAPSEPAYGDLLITEIMYNPSSISDATGEWIEVYNNSSHAINLKGLVIKRGSSTIFHKISSDVNIAAGAYAVLGRTSSATNNVSYVYSGIELTNSGCEIIISTYGTNGTDGKVICSVNYALTGFLLSPEGKSLQLNPTVKYVNDLNTGSNWCAAKEPYSTGDYGTPGMVNSTCN